MNIKLDKHAGIPLSQQIKQEIEDRIRSGLIEKGSKLPSVRKLSTLLQVSPVTIIKAYQQLEKEGLIEKIQGKGTYVKSNKIERSKKEKQVIDPYQWQMAIPDYLSRSQFSLHLNLSYQNDELNLAVASLHHQLLPTTLIAQYAYHLLSMHSESLSRYGPVQGDLELRKEIAKYFNRKGLHTSDDHILITSGAQQGISLIANTFVSAGDTVVLEAPTYPGAIDIFRSKGASILTVPIDQEGMRIDILHLLCEKYNPKLIYTIPNVHNPTGYSMSNKRKLELMDLAQEYNCIIVEDDPWSEISFYNKKRTLLKSLDKTGHVIYVKGFSKVIGPAYRIGAIAAEGSFLSRLIAAKANIDLGTPILTQKAVLQFIKSGNLPKYIDQLNGKLKKRRDLVHRILKENLPPEISWTLPDGGINIWIKLPNTLYTDILLSKYAQKENINFLPGIICYPNEPERNYIRISFSYLSEKELKEATITLSEIIKKYLADKKEPKGTPVV